MRVAIVQARLGSTRLPGKVLRPLAGVPLLKHVIDRTLAARKVDRLVVATTTEDDDDALARWVQAQAGCGLFRGSRDDVLDRFYRCAEREGASIIVRVTADDPIKDPEIIDRAVGMLEADPALDYCSNTLKPTFPEGLDIEVFRFKALETAQREAQLASEREHVTPFIWKRGERFKLANFEHDEDLSDWRWTVDKEDDLRMAERIFRGLEHLGPLFSYRDAIAYVKANPAIRGINAGTVRNEGYLNSMREDHP